MKFSCFQKCQKSSLFYCLFTVLFIFSLNACEQAPEPNMGENISGGTIQSEPNKPMAKDGVESANIVFINGKILIVDPSFSIAQSIAIKNDRIVAVGTNEKVQEIVGSDTQIVDLNGKTMIPGLIDNHRRSLLWLLLLLVRLLRLRLGGKYSSITAARD